jgi:hypothetical protein
MGMIVANILAIIFGGQDHAPALLLFRYGPCAGSLFTGG